MSGQAHDFLNTSTGLAVLFVGVIAAYLRSRWTAYTKNPKNLPLPPGPPGKPLVGNLNDVPKSGYEWLAYENLAKVYGM